MKTKQLKVLILGESLECQGGIVSVEKLILQQVTSDIHLSHIATLAPGSRIHKLTTFLKALLQLIWTLSVRHAKLLHIHVSERGSAFRQAVVIFIAWMLRTPVIAHAHGAEFHLFYKSLPKISQLALTWIFRRCDRFIVLSETWKNFYVSMGLESDRIIVLPNPVKLPSQLPKRRTRSQKVKFLFLGRIGKRKGAFDLLQAFSNLTPDHLTKAELTLAGDGELEEASQVITDSQCSKHINLLSWVSPEKRDLLLEEADVFVLPSYNEGLPMAILEAMSWELPVLTTPVGGIPELIQDHDNGVLVEPGDINQLAEAMSELIDDADKRVSLGKSARRSILAFDINCYFARLSEIYYLVAEKEH